MNMLLARSLPVTTTVIFDATTHVNRLPAFGRGLDTAASRKAERDARRAASDAFFTAALMHEADLDRKYGPVAPMPAYLAEGMVREPMAKGYDATDLADFAAGRLLTAEQVRDRAEAEDDLRLMACQPADLDSEYVFEA